MSITLTFFKKASSTKSENFYGNGHAGSAKGEWKLLLADKKFRDIKVKTLVIEYEDASHLPKGYEKKVTWSPYLDLRWDEDTANSVHYPQKGTLDKSHVLEWVSDVANHMRTTKGNTSEVKTGAATTTVVVNQPKSSSWVAPVALGLAGIGIGYAIIVGTGADKKIAKMYRNYASLDDDYDGVDFYDERGDKTNSRNVSWQKVERDDVQLL